MLLNFLSTKNALYHMRIFEIVQELDFATTSPFTLPIILPRSCSSGCSTIFLGPDRNLIS